MNSYPKGGKMSNLDELETLYSLKEKGIITEANLKQKKPIF